MKLLTNIVYAAALFAATPFAWAAPEPLTAAQSKGVIDALTGQIQKIYVFPEKRAQIVEAIRADNARGRYAVGSHRELAERLSETLMAASNDKHLNVSFDPQRAAALAEPDDRQMAAFFDAEGVRWNQGYVRQEILPGNIRYVRIKGFYWTEKATPGVIDSAARFLAGGSAAIIDLRGNGGGHAAAVQRMISYLMPPASTELMTFFDGRTGKSEVTKSTAKLPAPRISGRALYVLTDRGSVSAAEEFAYHIQQFKLGKLVGETTAGAANNNVLLPLPDGFVGSISYGRPVHPVSKTNWEGVGVAPDLASPSHSALDVAVAEALKALANSDDPKVKADALWELPAAEARKTPVRVTSDSLKALAGKYGEREIKWTEGGLSVHRQGRPPLSLVPISDGLFAVAGIEDVRFKFTGQGTSGARLDVIFRDGRIQSANRDGAS